MMLIRLKSFRSSVLIETYWNVNTLNEVLTELERSSINRNILECKYPGTTTREEFKLVLIETYWNVNSLKNLLEKKCVLVLIETYWNVNSEVQELFNYDSSINRNILECK